MKKLYIVLSLLLISTAFANAQSFTASNVQITGIPIYLNGHATITNNSSTSKDVLVERTINNLVPGHISYFCWFECYGDSVNLSPDIITIDAGSSTSIFSCYLENPNSISGVTYNKYCFFDAANPSDSVCVDYLFDTTTGIEEIPAGKNYISKPYPNPAVQSTNFYVNVLGGTKNASLKFFNMLGAEVKSVALTENRNSVKVNVSNLKAGIYFYSLYINGKSTSTGKLMIARD